jgi:hypothetical protein
MKVGHDSRIPPSTCTGCGHALTASSGVGNDDVPDPGSVSICVYCGKMTVFDENLMLREPTEAERKEILEEPCVQAARRAVVMTRRGEHS